LLSGYLPILAGWSLESKGSLLLRGIHETGGDLSWSSQN
jgi:hypothetical protein